MKITYTLDARGLTAGLSKFARQEVPFAAARALTDVAWDAAREAAKQLPREFNIRTGWVAKGFRVDKATKYQLVAKLWHKDPFMGRQFWGGEKEGQGGKAVAVPAFTPQPGARTRSKPTTPKMWPGALPRTFTVEQEGKTLVFQRTGRKRGGRGRTARFPTHARLAGLADPDVRLMYVMQDEVKVPARWQLREHTARVVSDGFSAKLRQHLAAAHAPRRR